jgi:hypothetical protein
MVVVFGMKTNNLPVSGLFGGWRWRGRDNFRGFIMRLRLD